MPNITMIEGVGEICAQKLEQAGIRTTEELLERGTTARGRQEIAERSGILEALILRWASSADLFRIIGVGEEYADLLITAGVNNVSELAQSDAEQLHQQLAVVCQEKMRARHTPALSRVSDWIAQAKRLPAMVS
jgi:predicted flap endonuclease-1-like 5' DNA nuclease